MSWGGGQRSAYGLHKFRPAPPGPTVFTKPPSDGAGSGSQTRVESVERFDGKNVDPDAERINHFIKRVNELQGQSSSSSSGLTRPDRKLKINVHTAHLLMHTYMFPQHNPIVGDTVDAHLSRWEPAWEFALESQFKANVQKEVKTTGKEQMNKTGLEAALKNMGFQVSKEVLTSLMSAFQTCDPNQLATIDNIDYNYFIQCCIFAEVHTGSCLYSIQCMHSISFGCGIPKSLWMVYRNSKVI